MTQKETPDERSAIRGGGPFFAKNYLSAILWAAYSIPKESLMEMFRVSSGLLTFTIVLIAGLALVAAYYAAGRREARRTMQAYKTYLDAMIGLGVSLESIQEKARELFNALSESMESYPYPNALHLESGKTLLGYIASAMNKSPSEAWVIALVAHMNRLYILQEEHHLTGEISRLRRAFEGAIMEYNVHVERAVSVEKMIGEYHIPVYLTEKKF